MSWWLQAEQDAPGLLLTSNTFQLLLWDSEVLPGQLGYVIPAWDRSDPEQPRRNPDQILKPPLLAPFRLFSLWMCELLTLSPRLNPASLWRNLVSRHLYPPPCPFSRYPELLTVREGQNVDRPLNRLGSLFTMTLQYSACIKPPFSGREP